MQHPHPKCTASAVSPPLSHPHTITSLPPRSLRLSRPRVTRECVCLHMSGLTALFCLAHARFALVCEDSGGRSTTKEEEFRLRHTTLY